MAPGPPVPVQRAGGASCPEACALQTLTSLSQLFSQPKSYLCTMPTCYLEHVPRLLGQPCFSAALQSPPMSSFPFTCTGEGKQREVSGGLSTPPSIPQAGSPLTTGEDLGYVTTLCMSQQASAPKHSFGLHLSILTKYLKA